MIESLFVKQIKFPDSINEDNYTAYYNTLGFLQEQLKSRGTTFFDGNEPGYADYMIWPFFERLQMFDTNTKMRIDKNKYPLLVEYLKNMLNDPVVSEYLIPLDILRKFVSAYSTGTKPQYDMLIEN